MRGTASKVLRRLLLVGTSALFGVLLAEIGVRAIGAAAHLYTQPSFEWSRGQDYWRYRPGFEGRVHGPTEVRIGALGNRAHGSSEDEGSSSITVAVVGDSVTFGQGVGEDETFAAVTERALRERGLPVRVLNFGVQGHTVEMEIAHLSDRLTAVDPEVVVLAFITDDLNPRRGQSHVDRYGYLTKEVFGPRSWWGDTLRAGLRRSHLALLTKSALLNLRTAGEAPAAGASPANRPAAVGEANREKLLNRFRASMHRFVELTDGVGRIVICLDTRETELSRRLRQTMEDEFPEVVYLDAPPRFAGYTRDQIQVPKDGHPNAVAHEVYAEFLVPSLTGVLASPVAREAS